MSQNIDAAGSTAAPRPGLFLPLMGGLAAILACAAAWFLVLAGVALAGAWALGGAPALAELGARMQALNPARASGGAPGMTSLFLLACILYGCMGAGVVTYARLRGGRAGADALAWRGVPPLRLRHAWWLAPMVAYHALATLLVRAIAPDYALNLFIPIEPAALALSFMAVVVFAPLAEELFFRGWLYGVLRARMGGVAALLACAGAFALAHWDGTGFYPLAVFLPGLALTILRARTGSAQASALAHAVYNGVGWAGLVAISALR
ncbi:MAG: CPBP family intramembrane glutamic endopeptidase [Beijerinckiaceae bacterium]|jgi:membrane protease YdiL (CAAX protease family)